MRVFGRQLLPRLHETCFQLVLAQLFSNESVTTSAKALSPIISGQSDSKHLLKLILLIAFDSNIPQISPAGILIVVSVILFVFDLPKLS